MDHTTEFKWPYWITLGGDTIMPCVGSVWLAIIYIILCASIVVGYVVIGIYWHTLEKLADTKEGKLILRNLRDIFMWCALSGYGFMIIRTALPFWLPYLLSIGWLNYITWRYVFRLRKLRDD